MSQNGPVFGIDKSKSMIENAIVTDGFTCKNGDIRSFNLEKKFDAVIFDLGLSSIQLDDLSRGFSFKSKRELNMSMGQTEQSAKKVLN